MSSLNINNVAENLIRAVPELRASYEDELSWWDGEDPGAHIVFGSLLTPELIEALRGTVDVDYLTRVFSFLEVMASTNDKLVQEVVAFSVLESLAEEEATMVNAWRYMGPKTRSLTQEVCDYWGFPGLPGQHSK